MDAGHEDVLTELLDALAAAYPNLSKGLTRETKNVKGKLAKKAEKARQLFCSHRAVFDELIAPINRKYGIPYNPLDVRTPTQLFWGDRYRPVDKPRNRFG